MGNVMSKAEDMQISGGFPKLGVPFRGPHNMDSNAWGSLLGFPHLEKVSRLLWQLVYVKLSRSDPIKETLAHTTH